MADLTCLDLGAAGYEAALKLQHRLADRVRGSAVEQAFLILVEHDPPVITLGRSGRDEHVLADPRTLRREGIELRRVARGGDVTWHGPGQLVAYPILRLDLHGRDVRGYLRDLESAVLRALRAFGIEGARREGLTGVWVGREKLAAIGVAVRRWVTLHGLALNVCPDLAQFERIVPCGIPGEGVTSLSKLLGRPVSVSQVKPAMIESIVETFGFERAIEASPQAYGFAV